MAHVSAFQRTRYDPISKMLPKNYYTFRHRGRPGGHRDARGQRPEPDAVGEADGDRGRGRIHQDPHRRRNKVKVDSEATLVPVLEDLLTSAANKNIYL